jgi:WD40 repeat protein
MKVYTGGDGTIRAVTRCGPAGNQVAAYTDSSVYVWGDDSTRPAQVLPAEHRASEHADLIASPDGKWLAAYAHDRLRCWQFNGGSWRPQIDRSEPGLCAVQFDPTGTALLTVVLNSGAPGAVDAHLMRSPLSQPYASQKMHRGFVVNASRITSPTDLYKTSYFAVDLAADGSRFLLSACEKVIHLWNIPGHTYIGGLKTKGLSNEAALSPDGSAFAVDCGTTVYVQSTPALQQMAAWKVKYCYYPKLAWSPDGRRLARSDFSSTVRIYDVAARKEVFAWSARGHRGHRGTAVAWSPDGLTCLVGTFCGNVVVWDVE